ncbi:hypothetical protein PIB30_007647 [Stylosanthes scabra]|uniref:Uncharacterized protein n=1 Tax=Stylosanthes scabra TaxID=79078 RepID=A0ABU6V5F0_9FABA|nr:hypothetical protein [Stylosanthes scabra]
MVSLLFFTFSFSAKVPPPTPFPPCRKLFRKPPPLQPLYTFQIPNAFPRCGSHLQTQTEVPSLHRLVITEGKMNTFMPCFMLFENGKYVGMKVLMKFEVLGLVSTNMGDGRLPCFHCHGLLPFSSFCQYNPFLYGLKAKEPNWLGVVTSVAYRLEFGSLHIWFFNTLHCYVRLWLSFHHITVECRGNFHDFKNHGSIRRRALDLLYGMCDISNAKDIVEELLQVWIIRSD